MHKVPVPITYPGQSKIMLDTEIEDARKIFGDNTDYLYSI